MPRPGRLDYGWAVVAGLCVTETVSWGIIYYGFPVMLRPMEAELGFSRAEITGAFSAGLAVAALAGLPVGRWIDRHRARRAVGVVAHAARAVRRVDPHGPGDGGRALRAGVRGHRRLVPGAPPRPRAAGRHDRRRVRQHDLHADRGVAARPLRLAAIAADARRRARRDHDPDPRARAPTPAPRGAAARRRDHPRRPSRRHAERRRANRRLLGARGGVLRR